MYKKKNKYTFTRVVKNYENEEKEKYFNKKNNRTKFMKHMDISNIDCTVQS